MVSLLKVTERLRSVLTAMIGGVNDYLQYGECKLPMQLSCRVWKTDYVP